MARPGWVNFRISEQLSDLIDRAVLVSDSTNRSDWAREVLEAGAWQELARYEARRPNPVVVLGVRRRLLHPSGCLHPAPARVRRVGDEVCTMCGVSIRRLM